MPIEVRREQALDAALRLITDEGYGALTMEGVARAAGLSKPVVYNAYPGRTALLAALLAREEQRALGALAAAMPPRPADAEPSAALLEWLERLAHAIAANPAPWRLMLLPPGETPGVVRERVEAGRRLALEQARSLIRTLLRVRAPRVALDEELAAHSLLAACEQAAKLMLAEPERYPPGRLVAYAEGVLRALGLR